MAEGVEVEEVEKEIARVGIEVQLEAHNLLHLLENKNFKEFIDNQVEVIAADKSYINMLTSKLIKI